MNAQISDLVTNYDRISFVAAVVLHSFDLHSHRQIPIFTALLERLAQNKKACYEVLQRYQRNLMGEDLGPLSCKELEMLKSQLDSSLKQIRSTRLVESVLIKVVEEFEHRIASQDEQFMQMKFHEEFSNLGMHIHGLAHAASGYHRVLEENGKLYNEVQDLKGSIKVYCRVRPFLSGQPNHLSTVENMEDELSQLMFLQRMGKGADPSTLTKSFGPSAAQGEVFADMQPLIRSVLDGFNV
ncbi:hypothetical protein TSUD_398100 [Trifolium subterraneum]|uniref:Kinesin motor domain-containing protein n=1 Tax=Trifolium subterraneum TaxID=3900 RepID=A0A2Z6N8M4_TRISU|nr:hypothetical protein TSUD_398100 [Trifolium subterraneum]